MQYLKYAFRILGLLVLAFLLYAAVILVYGSLKDFKPEGIDPLISVGEGTDRLLSDSVFSVLIWNIGYCGLGEESDFFYQGGSAFFLAGDRMVRPEKSVVEKNLRGVSQLTASTRADFFLFQELDSCSKRSYYTNQLDTLGANLPGYGSWYAVNYQVDWVPIPILEPWRAYGKTHSGLAAFSKYRPSSVVRAQLPGKYPWPNSLFQLDRCAQILRFDLNNGKELILVNIHNAAFDKGGKIKAQQMAYLKTFFLEAYEKGNYVLAGGDWNQCPPYFPFDKFFEGDPAGFSQINIDPGFLPSEWRWPYGPLTPTNRKTITPYMDGESFVTTIDFFLISPNVKVRQVRVIDHGFQYSDHQPVWIEVELE